jgi:hypothetical protein
MTTHRTIRLPLLALLALIASVGCGRPGRDADRDQMARRFCGEYRAKGAGGEWPPARPVRGPHVPVRGLPC